MAYEFYRIYPEKVEFKTYDTIHDVADFGLCLSRKYKKPVILNVNGTKIGITPGDGLLINKKLHIINLYRFATSEKTIGM